jgi:hypothetical protein
MKAEADHRASALQSLKPNDRVLAELTLENHPSLSRMLRTFGM